MVQRFVRARTVRQKARFAGVKLEPIESDLVLELFQTSDEPLARGFVGEIDAANRLRPPPSELSWFEISTAAAAFPVTRRPIEPIDEDFYRRAENLAESTREHLAHLGRRLRAFDQVAQPFGFLARRRALLQERHHPRGDEKSHVVQFFHHRLGIGKLDGIEDELAVARLPAVVYFDDGTVRKTRLFVSLENISRDGER